MPFRPQRTLPAPRLRLRITSHLSRAGFIDGQLAPPRFCPPQARQSSEAFFDTALLLAIVRSPWQTLPVLIGLFPELDAPGGAQRARRHPAAVLTEFASSRGMDCRLLTLNDSPELHRMTLGGREFVFTGCERGKGGFMVTAVRGARRKAKLGPSGPPDLGPSLQGRRIAGPRMKRII